eukprot:60487_1
MSLAIMSFGIKICQVMMSKCGCKDPEVDGQQNEESTMPYDNNEKGTTIVYDENDTSKVNDNKQEGTETEKGTTIVYDGNVISNNTQATKNDGKHQNNSKVNLEMSILNDKTAVNSQQRSNETHPQEE